MKRLLLFVILCLFFSYSRGQVYLMGNASVSTCTGNFYDSGGAGSDYTINENSTITFCSSSPGQCVKITFSSFDVETNFDFLSIYDGPGTSSPLIGTFTGTTIPSVLTATSGCLTINFTSDGSINHAGWVASLSCAVCPTNNCAVACNGGASPSNEDCGTALQLGVLPAPALCVGGVGGTGGVLSLNTSNLCATASNPYYSLNNCQPSGSATMASPAADVWYAFTVTGSVLTVNISGGLLQPSIGLYSGSNCASLVGRGCAIGANGLLNASFNGLSAGVYYLQVSGGSLNDQCDFTLDLENDNDCSGCVIASNLVASPPPVNGSYGPGQLVNFCYTITNFNQSSVNWLHGVVPVFGSGWNLASLTTNPPPACATSGTWGWYNSVTSTNTGNTYGPGFFFETAVGNAGGLADNNPGNNFGDNNPSSCGWTFCFSIRTPTAGNCTQGADLSVTVNTYGDATSGSWSLPGCANDPPATFISSLLCCTPPNLIVIDPLCNTLLGSATAQGQGTGPWDYNWLDASGTSLLLNNNVNGSSGITNLAAGNYSVVVTDNTGCSTTTPFTISLPPPLNVSLTPTAVSCNGLSNGSIITNVSGGTPGYNYSWSPSGSGQNPVGLAANTYTVTVSDSKGCTTTASAVVTQQPAVQATINPVVNVNCPGAANGTATVIASGGTPGYSYLWSNSSIITSVSNLSGGTYSVTVTDSRGCTAVNSVIISEPSPFVLAMGSTASSCGFSNGSASVIPSGGTSPYTYAWTPTGGTSSTANSLSSGGYNVTVTDSRGCTAINSTVVSNGAGPTASVLTETGVSCNGLADGSASIAVNGGTSPYVIGWSPTGGNGLSASGLAGGPYVVTVTDNTGCTSTVAVNISSPASGSANIISVTNILCNGNSTGSATVSAGGGTPGYSYSWSNGSLSATAANLSAATYTVTVTDSKGCTVSTSVTPAQPTPLNASVPFSGSPSCNGGSNGSAVATASGGSSPYTYLWSTGTTSISSGSVAAGTYSVTVTDANGCTDNLLAIIADPALLTAQISASTPAGCGGAPTGSGTITAAGGTPGYTYLWSPSGGISNTATNLAAGTYTITVTDSKGCTASVPFNLSGSPALNLQVNATDVTCNGNSNGSVQAVVSGGTAPFTYLWSGGQTTATVNNLPASSYTVTVSDQGGCQQVLSATVNSPSPLGAFISVTQPVSCNGSADGSIKVIENGGTSPYQYVWNNGNTTAVNSLLAAGNYSVTVTDANGCNVQSAFVLTQPLPVNLSFSTVNASCGASNGSAAVTAVNGTPAYSYQWSSGDITASAAGLAGGVYTVTVTDALGCTSSGNTIVGNSNGPALSVGTINDVKCKGGNDGTADVIPNGGALPYVYAWLPNVSNTASATNLIAGNYLVTATDANGCSAQVSFQVNEPPVLTAAVAVINNVSCNAGTDGNLTVNASGGTPGYSYVWSSGLPAGLPQGNYTVTITDANGCTLQASNTITEPSPVAVNLLVNSPATCNNGNDGLLSVAGTGGIPGYTYLWSDNSTLNTLSTSAGNYTVTVSDLNGCSASSTFTITQPAPLNSVITPVDAACGQSNGQAQVNVAGGTGPYQYLWNTAATSSAISNLAAGIYTVTVTDAAGCITNSSNSVGNLGGPVLAAGAIISPACNGLSDGSASVNVSGGNGVITYAWIPNVSTTSSAQNLPAGTYNVTVNDINGCQSSIALNVIAPPSLQIQFSTTSSHCSQADGSADAIVSGGTGPYNYVWSAGSFSQQQPNIPGGNYTLTVTDVNGCVFSDITTVSNLPGPSITSLLPASVSCFGLSDGSAQVIVNGGTSPYSYLWSDGTLAALDANLSSGSYTVTVTDATGCQVSQAVNILQPSQINLVINTNPATCGLSNGSAVVIPAGGSAPYNFQWSGGILNDSISNQFNGNYTITVTDNAGCTASGIALIPNTSGPTINLVTQTQVSCAGGSDGSVSVNISGSIPANGIQWLPAGGNSSTASGLSAGAYTVTATDLSGCSAVLNIQVTEPLALTVNNLTTPVSCNGGNDGTATIDALDGTAPYTYLWNPGGLAAASRINLNGGSYTVTVTDANGCSLSTTAVVSEPALVSAAETITGPLCAGGTNGNIGVVASGGTGVYSYLWSDGTSGSNLLNASAGVFTLTVSDNNGCAYTQSYVVNDPPIITSQETITPSVCGSASGGIAVVTGGGTGNLFYQWSSPSGSGLNAINLAAGTYSLTITDQNGCNNTFQYSVPDMGGAVLNITSAVNASCNGSADGSAVVNAAGNAPFTYSWLPSGGNAANASNLVAGNYTVQVTDINGCVSALPLVISEPSLIQPVINSFPASCGTANGYAVANTSGGNTPYQFTWSGGVAVADSVKLLAAGVYTLTVSDQSGCQVTTPFNIASVNGPAVSGITINNASCNGFSDGSATIVVAGNVSYSWFPSGGTAATATGLPANSYTVSITDVNGCTVVQPVVITQPLPVLGNSIITPAVCSTANGVISLSPTGGTAPYTYLWSNGFTGSTQQQLPAAGYTVTVTDSRGCTSIENLQVNNLAGPAISPGTITDVSCYGVNDGSASVQVTGSGSYTYSWLPAVSTTSNAINLAAGSYQVVVADLSGCSSSLSVLIASPPVISSSAVTLSGVSCFGGNNGSALVSASGGSAPFAYAWSNGSFNDTITGVNAGTYSVTITDANGCMHSDSVTITAPTLLSSLIQLSDSVSCFGFSDGTLSIAATGGTAPYTYLWSNGFSTNVSAQLPAGIYTITVTDSRGCASQSTGTVASPAAISLNNSTQSDVTCNGFNNGTASLLAAGGSSPYIFQWSDGTIGSSDSNLFAGTYTVTVTDANNCSQQLNVLISEPPILSTQAVIVNASCSGAATGSIDLSPSGGTSPYSINWLSSGSSSALLSNLAAGQYNVLVTDANNCTSGSAWIITEPPVITGTVSAPGTICIGGGATLMVTNGGGSPPYSYLWSNGVQSQLNVVSPAVSSSYSVTTTDVNGCTMQVNNIPVNVFPPLSLNALASDYSICNGQTITLSAVPSGGNGGPYTISWPGNITGNTFNITPGLSSTYAVSVTDNCTSLNAVAQVNIIVNALPDAGFQADVNEGCSPLSVLFTSPSSPGYVYNWNFGNDIGQGAAPANQFNDPGYYDIGLTVTDSNGCVGQTVQPALIHVFAVPVADFTANPYEASLVVPQITFTNQSIDALHASWNFGDNSSIVNEWSATHIYQDTGHYSVQLIVSSDDGCIDTAYREVVISGGSVIYIPNAFSPNNDGVNDLFTASGIGISKAEFIIFNRWGKQIFSSGSLDHAWDGTDQSTGDICPEGTYIYLFRIQSIDNKSSELTGRINLIR